MFEMIPLAMTVFLASSLVQAGYFGGQLRYSSGPFASSHQYKVPYDTSYESPSSGYLPVAPVSADSAFKVFTYSAPNFYRVRGRSGGFGCGPSLRSRPKFAFDAPIPPVYDVPAPVDFGSSDVNYSGFEEPNIVVKFGPPITTTTTTYSTAAAGVHVRTPFKASGGW